MRRRRHTRCASGALEDPFAGGISIDPGNFSRDFSGNASNHRRILRGRGFRYAKANLAERAAIADRSIDICEPVEAPDYRSYSQPGNGNVYSPYWSFNYTKQPTCGSCDWKVTGKQANVVYTTENVYELRLFVKFLVWIKENNAAIEALVGGRNNVVCPLLLNKLVS